MFGERRRPITIDMAKTMVGAALSHQTNLAAGVANTTLQRNTKRVLCSSITWASKPNRYGAIMMKRITVIVAAIVLCTAGSVYAISFGGPGGKWPKTWPKELEPLRKEAWTWEHGFGGMSYDIPFATKEEFEAAWPHILTLKTKDARIYLL